MKEHLSTHRDPLSILNSDYFIFSLTEVLIAQCSIFLLVGFLYSECLSLLSFQNCIPYILLVYDVYSYNVTHVLRI